MTQLSHRCLLLYAAIFIYFSVIYSFVRSSFLIVVSYAGVKMQAKNTRSIYPSIYLPSQPAVQCTLCADSERGGGGGSEKIVILGTEENVVGWSSLLGPSDTAQRWWLHLTESLSSASDATSLSSRHANTHTHTHSRMRVPIQGSI